MRTDRETQAIMDALGIAFLQGPVIVQAGPSLDTQSLAEGHDRGWTPCIPPELVTRLARECLSLDTLRQVAATIVGSDEAKVTAFEQQVLDPALPRLSARALSLAECERTVRLAYLFVRARTALGTDVEAREFLLEGHPMLAGRAPIDVSGSPDGGDQVMRILNTLEHGLAL
ncbi:antitoxin Xre/MbcA/ParS toxin-binding domain-containing protein [Pararoseomonas sp. SCSIO 73927]|uniref:antitoxin Xre/MbcA/ParS toxin-binding domain-containing protein n=1 Tax=Pararoseomonas sp. SCSIO 73927 TaxID=3114537 RepID=UPI0038CFDB4A